ncbi:MAG: MSMEG_0568 family radical SAM protein [Candidatus Helarchaeota archaeon]
MTHNIAELKIKLQSYGLRSDLGTNKGRKGGAGSAGGRFFRFSDGSCANIPLWPSFTENSPYLLREGKIFFNEIEIENVTLIPIPKFYLKKTSDNIPMKKIALLHGTDCLASTVVQTCIYWRQNCACQFCGIELSLKDNATITRKTPQQLHEVVDAAIQEGVCNHMTLTIGSLANPDKGIKIYADIVREIRKDHKLPIHVQLEPPENIKALEELYQVGVETIGIHLESFDRNILQKICPGKIQIPYEQYKNAWNAALDIFGENQVDSYVIVGLGESDGNVLKGVEQLSQLGIIPYVVPFRPITGTPMEKHSTPLPERLIPLFTSIAKLLRQYRIDPTKNKAGCVRCGACSPLTEAYKYL